MDLVIGSGKRGPAVPNRSLVLVVGDDPLVRGLVVMALRSIGYRALEANAARDRVAHHAPDVDLLVVDECASPSVDAEMVRQLRVSQPRLKVIHLTHRGPYDEARMGNGGIDVFLDKPFALDDLCDVVDCWLGGSLLPVPPTRLTIH